MPASKSTQKKTTRRGGVDIKDLETKKNPKGGGTAGQLAAGLEPPGAGANPLGLNFEEVKDCSKRNPK